MSESISIQASCIRCSHSATVVHPIDRSVGCNPIANPSLSYVADGKYGLDTALLNVKVKLKVLAAHFWMIVISRPRCRSSICPTLASTLNATFRAAQKRSNIVAACSSSWRPTLKKIDPSPRLSRSNTASMSGEHRRCVWTT